MNQMPFRLSDSGLRHSKPQMRCRSTFGPGQKLWSKNALSLCYGAFMYDKVFERVQSKRMIDLDLHSTTDNNENYRYKRVGV